MIGELLRERLGMLPVNGHAVAAHDAGAGEDERPARDAADAQSPLGEFSQPGERWPVIEMDRVAAGADEQQVERQIVADLRC